MASKCADLLSAARPSVNGNAIQRSARGPHAGRGQMVQDPALGRALKESASGIVLVPWPWGLRDRARAARRCPSCPTRYRQSGSNGWIRDSEFQARGRHGGGSGNEPGWSHRTRSGGYPARLTSPCARGRDPSRTRQRAPQLEPSAALDGAAVTKPAVTRIGTMIPIPLR